MIKISRLFFIILISLVVLVSILSYFFYRNDHERLCFYGHNHFDDISFFILNNNYELDVVEEVYVDRTDTYFHTIETSLPNIPARTIKLFFFDKKLYQIYFSNMKVENQTSILYEVENNILLDVNLNKINFEKKFNKSEGSFDVTIDDKYLSKIVKEWIVKWS